MGNKLYVCAVVLIWGASMSWLVSERILPPFFEGDPPATSIIRQKEPVAWQIQVDSKPCGIAVMQAIEGADGAVAVYSNVTLTQIPWPKSTPLWMSAFKSTIGKLSIEMHTRLGFDSLNRLADFESKFIVGDNTAPVMLRGRIVGNELQLKVRAAAITKDFKHQWTDQGNFASEIMPETKLLGIYEGKRWHREVFNPIASPHSPIELLEATVGPQERYMHNDEVVRVFPVEYQTPERVGTSDEERLKAKLLVAENGMVLKQELKFLGSRLIFTRLSEEASLIMAETRLEN